MITETISLANAAKITAEAEIASRLGMVSGTAKLFRVIASYEVLSNAGSDESPRWTRDTDAKVQVATFEHNPSSGEVRDAVVRQTRAFQSNDPLAPKWSATGEVEVLTDDALSEQERKQVAFFRSEGAVYNDPREPLFIACGGDQTDGYPKTWAPIAFAIAVQKACEEAIANERMAA